MIKTVFFTATLLVAGLAYGQNPSADLSVQVVKPGNGIGIPCARGPNYTGSIPAAAAKAGFTTCVVNSDFSMAQYQTLSNWLDCAGATTPTWFNVGYNAGVTPCSDYTIVTDTVHGNNQTVLDMAYTASDASIGPGTWMATKNGTNGGPLGYDFPIGAYYDLTFELLPANVNVFNTTSAKAICAGIGGSGTLYCELLDWFAVNVSPFQEIDFLETDVFGVLYPNGVTSGYLYNSGISGAPQFAYHTYGALVTTNGTTQIEMCSYSDISGTFTGFACGANKGGTANMSGRQTVGLGPSSGNTFPCSSKPGSTCPIPSQTLHARIAEMHVFSCANWATTQCPGTVITTP